MSSVTSSAGALNAIDSKSIVYRPRASLGRDTSTLVVDYDLSRHRDLAPLCWACCEMEDLPDGWRDITFEVHPYDALVQVRRDLYAISSRLAPKGELQVTIPSRSGAPKIAETLNLLFTQVITSRSRGVHHFVCRKPIPQTFTELPIIVEYKDEMLSRNLQFHTRPGLFSHGRIDPGTAFLLRSVQIQPTQAVLDVGCGYGAIGLVFAAQGAGITMLDVDARAVKAARHHLGLNNLEGTVILADCLEELEDNSFDVVVTNPPTHSGSQTLRHLFAGMARVARRSGRVILVVRRHLNYEKWLGSFGNLSRLAEDGQYKILEVKQPIYRGMKC